MKIRIVKIEQSFLFTLRIIAQRLGKVIESSKQDGETFTIIIVDATPEDVAALRHLGLDVEEVKET